MVERVLIACNLHARGQLVFGGDFFGDDGLCAAERVGKLHGGHAVWDARVDLGAKGCIAIHGGAGGGGNLRRCPNLHGIAKAKGEVGRHDSQDGVGLPADGQSLAGDGRVGVEEPVPDIVAEKDYGRGAGAVVFVAEEAAKDRLHVEGAEEPGIGIGPLHLKPAARANDAGPRAA